MGLYAATLYRATLTTSEAMGVIQATTTTPRRLVGHQAYGGCRTSGADETFETLLAFLTAGAPTGGTGVTPSELQESAVPLCDATEGAITVDPTQGDDIDTIPHHRRATFTWSADPGKEPISVDVDNAGFGWFTPVAPTVGAGLTVSMRFTEE